MDNVNQDLFDLPLPSAGADRRRKRGGPRKPKWNLKELKAQHRQVIRMKASGMSQVDIAKAMGKTPVWVGQVLASTAAKEKMEVLQSAADLRSIDTLAGLKELTPLALETFEDLLLDDNVSKSLKLQAAKEIMKMDGFGGTQTIIHEHRLGDAEIQEAKRRATLMAKEVNLISEADLGTKSQSQSQSPQDITDAIVVEVESVFIDNEESKAA